MLGFSSKLLLGQARQVGGDRPKDFNASNAVCELLTEVIHDPDNCTLELSSLEKICSGEFFEGIKKDYFSSTSTATFDIK